ncbi:MAG TPA: peptidylprolyl isomerase [Verrucomicrobiae bacterium]|nr:peptidylprolyl isomerase [Verrucomicrobiae bacterium]
MKIWVTPVVFVVAIASVCHTLAEEKPKATARPASSVAPQTASAPAAGEVVARVNGTEIKRSELDAAVQAVTAQMARRGRQALPRDTSQLEHDLLEEMVGRELLLEEGSKHAPADVDQKTQAQIEMTKKQFGGEEQFRATLAETGLTPEEYAKHVHDNVIVQAAIQQLVDKEVKVSPEEVKSYYDKNPDQFRRSETVRASHILIRVPPDASDEVKKEKRAQIEAARALIKSGEKFADVARKVSEDPGTAASGGDLGFFPRGAMVPEFEMAAFSLKTNELSDIITTQYGYHLLLVTDRRPAGTVPFDEVKDRLGEFLKQRKGNDALRNHVAELRKTAKVEILLPPSPATSPGIPK